MNSFRNSPTVLEVEQIECSLYEIGCLDHTPSLSTIVDALSMVLVRRALGFYVNRLANWSIEQQPLDRGEIR
jgi:hypothetical protein